MPGLATTATIAAPSRGGPDGPSSPPAARLSPPRWLDLRLVLGALLILGSILVGARVIAMADDTVAVLVAAEDLAVDRELVPTLVETRQVRVEDGLHHYIEGSAEAVTGYVVVRPVAAGELLPRTAVAPGDDRAEDVRLVTVALPATELPAGLRAGSVVDVWIAPAQDVADRVASRLLSDVTVARVEGGGGGLGVSGSERPVTLTVSALEAGDLDRAVARLVAAARDGLVYLAGRPGGPDGSEGQG